MLTGLVFVFAVFRNFQRAGARDCWYLNPKIGGG